MAGTLPENASDEEKADHTKLLTRLKRFTTPADAAKAIREQDKLISSGQLKKPLPAKATPEQLKAWRAENGIPEAPDKYDLAVPDVKFDDNDKPIIETLVAELHASNANNDVVKGALKAYAKIKSDQVAAMEELNVTAKKAVEDELRAEWGQDYRPNVEAVGAMLAHGGGELQELIYGARMPDGTLLAHNPVLAKWLAGHARELGFVAGTVTQQGGDIGKSMDEEIKSIEATMYDEHGRKGSYWDNEKVQARYTQLLGARDRRKAA